MPRLAVLTLSLPSLALGACLARTVPIPAEPEQMAFDVPLAFIGYSVTARCESGELVMQVDKARDCLHLAYRGAGGLQPTGGRRNGATCSTDSRVRRA
jgi:hypothetical protein